MRFWGLQLYFEYVDFGRHVPVSELLDSTLAFLAAGGTLIWAGSFGRLNRKMTLPSLEINFFYLVLAAMSRFTLLVY